MERLLQSYLLDSLLFLLPPCNSIFFHPSCFHVSTLDSEKVLKPIFIKVRMINENKVKLLPILAQKCLLCFVFKCFLEKKDKERSTDVLKKNSFLRKQKNTSVGVNLEKLETMHIFCGHVKCCRCFGKQYDASLQS